MFGLQFSGSADDVTVGVTTGGKDFELVVGLISAMYFTSQ